MEIDKRRICIYCLFFDTVEIFYRLFKFILINKSIFCINIFTFGYDNYFGVIKTRSMAFGSLSFFELKRIWM